MTHRLTLLLFVATVIVGVHVTAQSITFSRGDHVRTKAPMRPAEMVLTIVAVGGDRIVLADDKVLVNDQPVGRFSAEFLSRVAHDPSRVLAVVPANHYFVMGEARINENVSEYWGIHSGVSLEALR